MIRIDEIWLATEPLDMRAATIMGLIQCAKLNSHDPYAYLKDVLERLPTQKASRLHLPLVTRHRGRFNWQLRLENVSALT